MSFAWTRGRRSFIFQDVTPTVLLMEFSIKQLPRVPLYLQQTSGKEKSEEYSTVLRTDTEHLHLR